MQGPDSGLKKYYYQSASLYKGTSIRGDQVLFGHWIIAIASVIVYIVMCQAHPALVKSGSNVRFVSF